MASDYRVTHRCRKTVKFVREMLYQNKYFTKVKVRIGCHGFYYRKTFKKGETIENWVPISIFVLGWHGSLKVHGAMRRFHHKDGNIASYV